MTAIALLVACGGGIDKNDLYNALEDAICDHRVACLEMPDKPTCLASLAYDDTEALTVLAEIDHTIAYDEHAAAACLDELRHQSCMFPGSHRANPHCFAMLTGKIPDGGACFVLEQCANQGVCVHTDASCDARHACCPGSCRAAVPLGADCTNAPCADGGYCSVTKVCTAYVAEGGMCEKLDACANPLYCDVSGMGSLGTCARPPMTGEACVPSSPFACGDIRDHCDATTTVCTRDAAVGEPCGGASMTQCVLFAECSGGSCVADPKASEACSGTATTSNCLGDLVCPSGTCEPAPAGIACK